MLCKYIFFPRINNYTKNAKILIEEGRYSAFLFQANILQTVSINFH